jgi:hypothetical protein
MSRFHHPYLTRGILYTSAGAFTVCRGVIETSDAIGQALGWRPVDDDHASDVRTDRVPPVSQPAVAADEGTLVIMYG